MTQCERIVPACMLPYELHMLRSLVQSLLLSSFRVLLELPAALWRCLYHSCWSSKVSTGGECTFYEGTVYHIRRVPVLNSFRYPTRLAVIELDQPPIWWQAGQYYTAEQARKLAGTAGRVRLLVNPSSAQYTQNPICVYYCCSETGALQKCIAVVTNTPWGAAVSFLFDPHKQAVPKALHVSPFMDMQNTWHLQAPMPGNDLHLSVCVSHPNHGNYFSAVLTGHVSTQPWLRNEEAGLLTLVKYGFQPQRVACLIYWQALKLWWKNVPVFQPPDDSYKDQANDQAAHEADTEGQQFRWAGAEHFPWNMQQ